MADEENEGLAAVSYVVPQSEIFALSKRYVEHIYEEEVNQAHEAFSLQLTKSDVQGMLDLMTGENDVLVAINGLHIENYSHTFTIVVLDEDGVHRPILGENAGVQRWKPRKTIAEIVEGGPAEEACAKIKAHFVSMGFNENSMTCP